MKNKLLSILLFSFAFLLNLANAQDLNQKYNITVWQKNFKGIETQSIVETLGFLPTYKNNREEITLGNRKIILESYLDIQMIEDQNNLMKVLLKYKDNNKQYNREIVIKDKEIKELEDFKIEIEKK